GYHDDAKPSSDLCLRMWYIFEFKRRHAKLVITLAVTLCKIVSSSYGFPVMKSYSAQSLFQL
ncbi:hypothetical protein BGZ92_005115, partial [Podila epicladia]